MNKLEQIRQQLLEEEVSSLPLVPDELKWIGSKDGIKKILKYGREIASEYQMYLDNDVDAAFGYDPEEDSGPPLSFTKWYKEYKDYEKECNDYFNSEEYLDEVARIADKGDSW